MVPKQENTEFTENIPQRLARKLKVISGNDRVDTFQPEDSSIKSEHHINVIPFKLKTSRKIYTGKRDQAKKILDSKVPDHAEETSISEFCENTSVNVKVAQGMIVKHVLNKAIDDQHFWIDLLENGSAALSEIKLSSEARAAIASGDVQWVYDNVSDIQEREMAFLYKRLEREAW